MQPIVESVDLAICTTYTSLLRMSLISLAFDYQTYEIESADYVFIFLDYMKITLNSRQNYGM